MAPRRQVIQVIGTEELLRLANDLRREADSRERIEELSYQLRRKAQPLARRAKSAALALPSRGQTAREGRRSLRADLAKSVSVTVITKGDRAGVRVFLSPKKMRSGEKTLPKYAEGLPGWGRWRSPLFGNYDKWYTHKSMPFFNKSMVGAEKDVVEAANEVIDRVERDLE